MNLTNEIRNFHVTSALPSNIIKKSREYFALAVLKYSFPERFSTLSKSEAPDLQDEVNNLGVEVTVGFSPKDEQIAGESVKFSHAKTDSERDECLRIIQKCGGDTSGFITSYPVSTVARDKANVIRVFRKKMSKVDQYHNIFQHVGLVIIIDIPLFLFYDNEWGKWFSGINDGKFCFVALIHWTGIEIFDFNSGDYETKRINREDMDALRKLGRMAAEGIIKDSDPVWK